MAGLLSYGVGRTTIPSRVGFGPGVRTIPGLTLPSGFNISVIAGMGVLFLNNTIKLKIVKDSNCFPQFEWEMIFG